jgi:hypothetical protein
MLQLATGDRTQFSEEPHATRAASIFAMTNRFQVGCRATSSDPVVHRSPLFRGVKGREYDHDATVETRWQEMWVRVDMSGCTLAFEFTST